MVAVVAECIKSLTGISLGRSYAKCHHHSPPTTNFAGVKGMILTDYFHSSYRDPSSERQIKQEANATAQKSLASVSFLNTPNCQKIAIITDKWSEKYSVYRTCFKQIATLKKRYHLTLITWRNRGYTPEMDIFHEIKMLNSPGALDLRSVRNSDFGLVYFPDIGMNYESVLLSNMRLAPIQVTGIGHSVSTFGSKIDYYISGSDVENEDAQQHYSEKLIRIPGFGCDFNKPNYTKHNKPHDTFVVNIAASKQKWNQKFLDTLTIIANSVNKKVLFQLFPGGGDLNLSWVPSNDSIKSSLKNIQIISECNYQQYMEAMELGDITLDSFHFGGCNSISDSLFLGIPPVALEGSRWYNRIGPAMLRRLRLSGLICKTVVQYINTAITLINDNSLLLEMADKICHADMDLIYNNGEEKRFTEAIDMLIRN